MNLSALRAKDDAASAHDNKSPRASFSFRFFSFSTAIGAGGAMV